MITVSEESNNTIVQEAFWFKLQQFKFDLFYYCNHYKNCVTVQRLKKIIEVGVTTLATLVWAQCPGVTWVKITCSISIIALQVINLIFDYLPFINRKDELAGLADDLNPIYIEMESIWRKIANGELTITEIQNSVDDFACKRLDVERHYLKNDFLPERKRYIKKAEENTQAYFNSFK